jgi:hypothetical protein
MRVRRWIILSAVAVVGASIMLAACGGGDDEGGGGGNGKTIALLLPVEDAAVPGLLLARAERSERSGQGVRRR